MLYNVHSISNLIPLLIKQRLAVEQNDVLHIKHNTHKQFVNFAIQAITHPRVMVSQIF